MDRGDVHKVRMPFPERPDGSGGPTDKYVVVMQGGPDFERLNDVAVLVCNTQRRPARPFEVQVGTREGFDHETVIDCRFPYTIPKGTTGFVGPPELRLPPAVMLQVAAALAVGLQLI